MKGFTLLELLVILVIVGVLATLAVPRWPGNSLSLEAQAAQLASAIRYLQASAMASGQTERISLILPASYSLATIQGDPIVLLSTGKATMTLSPGISLGAITALPNNSLVFDSQGVPYTDNPSIATQLTTPASITLVKASASRQIQITPITGRVLIQ